MAIDALRIVHAVVILAAVGTYTYYMFVGFHAQSFKYAKKSFEGLLEKNQYMKRDYEKLIEEKRMEDALQKQADELEEKAQRIKEGTDVDRVGKMDMELKLLKEQLAAKIQADQVAQMGLELKLLKEKLAASTDDVRFVNQKVDKKKKKANNKHGIKMDEKVDMEEQARRIKYQMEKLNIVPNGKAHISRDGIKVSNKEGVHVPEDFLEKFLENHQEYSDYEPESELEDLEEDYDIDIQSPEEDMIEEYRETKRTYTSDEELLAAFDYVEEPDEDLEDYEYEQDTGGFCDMEAEADTCD